MAKWFCLPLILIFLTSPKFTFASEQVVINEILPTPSAGDDWVELYNPSSQDVDLSNWILDDEGTTSIMFKIPEGEIIAKKTFKIFYVGNRLNKSGDVVYLKNNAGEIDRFEYKTTEVDISYGRYPDGDNIWGTCNRTPAEKNSSCQVVQEEKEDEPAIENELETSSIKKSNFETSKPSPQAKTKPKPTSSPSTLGEKNIAIPKLLSSSTPSATPANVEESKKSQTKVAGYLVGVGAILVAASLIFYIWYYKIRNNINEKVEDNSKTDKGYK